MHFDEISQRCLHRMKMIFTNLQRNVTYAFTEQAKIHATRTYGWNFVHFHTDPLHTYSSGNWSGFHKIPRDNRHSCGHSSSSWNVFFMARCLHSHRFDFDFDLYSICLRAFRYENFANQFLALKISGLTMYDMIAVYSLYMTMVEGALSVTNDRSFVLNMEQQAN